MEYNNTRKKILKFEIGITEERNRLYKGGQNRKEKE
jgi:hypothetical protein